MTFATVPYCIQLISLAFELAYDNVYSKFWAHSFMDPHGIVLLGVTFDSVTVRSREFWSMYIRDLTHATRSVRTQVKSTVLNNRVIVSSSFFLDRTHRSTIIERKRNVNFLLTATVYLLILMVGVANRPLCEFACYCAVSLLLSSLP